MTLMHSVGISIGPSPRYTASARRYVAADLHPLHCYDVEEM